MSEKHPRKKKWCLDQKEKNNLRSWVPMQIPMKEPQAIFPLQTFINRPHSISKLSSQNSFSRLLLTRLKQRRQKNIKGRKTFSLHMRQRNQASPVVCLHVRKTHLNQVQYNNWTSISLDKVFKMKSCGFKTRVLPWYWRKRTKMSNKHKLQNK